MSKSRLGRRPTPRVLTEITACTENHKERDIMAISDENPNLPLWALYPPCLREKIFGYSY